MRIEFVELINIRSHTKSVVPLAKGFNCLVGGLGYGKSTVLYAIDFAFFGEPIGRSYNYLLREDADRGKVLVQFIQNGKRYKISRELKRHRKGISQNFEELKLLRDESVVANMKADAVSEQFEAVTGLDKELFREIVWVRQEHLKELLDARPRERQRRLDELFSLSDYEKAWSNLAGCQREYEGEKRVYEKDADVLGMAKLNNEYNSTTEEFSLIEIELQNITKKIDEAKKELEEADSRLKKLERVQNITEELKRKRAEIQANLANLDDSTISLTEKIEKKKNSLDSLKQQLNNIEIKMKFSKTKLEEVGIPMGQSLKSLGQYISTFDDQISSLKGKQEAAFTHMQINQRKVSSLSAENRCPLCLQLLTAEYKKNLLQGIKEENSERQKAVSQLQMDIAKLLQIKSKANDAFSSLQILTPKIEQLKTRMDEESHELAELYKEYEEKTRLKNELNTRLRAIQEDIDKFDVSALEAAKVHREQVFRQYYVLESTLQTKEHLKRDLIGRLDEIKERIDRAQQKIERMGKIVKVIETIGTVRDAYRSIQPRLRSEFVKVLRNFIQQVLDDLVGEGPLINVLIDETYTPYVKGESGAEREVTNLSGGERTLLAFAYRLGLGQLIMQSKTGYGLSMLLLDEPTESLGREDGSIDRLAEAISRFRAIEQIIAVTHSEVFAERAEHVLRLEKELNVSRVSVEK